jgi:hypothetical protein
MIAIGASTTISNAIAIGVNSYVAGDNGVAMGTVASVSSSAGLALGYGASSLGSGSICLGQGISSAVGSVSVGNASTAAGNFSVCIGSLGVANGDSSVVIGYGQADGIHGLACGNAAYAGTDGSFVWSDNNAIGNTDTGANQFVLTALGGMYVYTSPSDVYFDSTLHATAYNPSDATRKTNIVEYPGATAIEHLRQIPVSQWQWKPRYINRTVTNWTFKAGIKIPTVRQISMTNRLDPLTHIGPMAQDWSKHFGGPTNEISQTDLNGVLLAAVKELDARVRALEAKLGTNR